MLRFLPRPARRLARSSVACWLLLPLSIPSKRPPRYRLPKVARKKKSFSQNASSPINRRRSFMHSSESAKIPDVPKETPTLGVNSVGIVGAGTMGGGIAMVFANAGIPVLLKETDQEALERGLANIEKNYANSIKRGRFTQQFVDERLKLIRPTLDYSEFAAVDIVVEAVFESMALKKEVFTQLDRVCKRNAILATNTSSLNIDEIASATSRPHSVIGTHFFSPANVMRLLEIVRGAA